MFVPGHLATGVLVGVVAARLSGRRASVRWMLAPAALGAVTPDLLDKSYMALGGSIYGRTVGHSALFLVGIAVVWALWWAWSARSLPSAPVGTAAPSARHSGRPRHAPTTLRTPFGFWVLGVGTHSLADLANDAPQGLTQGGHVISSWFGWPWATPYTYEVTASEPVFTTEGLGPWVAGLQEWMAPVTLLEAAVLVPAVGWAAVRGFDTLRRRQRGHRATGAG